MASCGAPAPPATRSRATNVNTDAWFLEQTRPTVYTEPSRDAANSLELWRSDLGLVRHLGLNTFRFSLEWARIELEPGQLSVAILDYYKAMIDTCRSLGLTPVVTFNHFATPRWFAGCGGWDNAEAPALFARYCDRAARHLAGGIGYPATMYDSAAPASEHSKH